MRSLPIRMLLLAVLGTFVLAGTPLARSLESDLKKEMKAKSSKTFYLKTNVPYFSGRHPYGTYKRPLVTVTAKDGVKIEQSAEIQGGAFHAEGRRLVLRVNDMVKTDDINFDSDENSLEIELVGTGRTGDGDGVLKFVDLRSMDDFSKCWEAAFSDVSIEQKYDWPADIKQAVVERKVLKGMTLEQVMVAVGDPEKISRSTDNGAKVEIWTIQRGEGSKIGFWTAKTGDKQEMEIRFENGKVTQIGGTEEQPGIKLK
ncbi:MAG TPA: hypothetical protein VFE84_10585 [Patescibacteria group bacterium]|nr:hypothetical protein [Patescibacteria group bacterium]